MAASPALTAILGDVLWCLGLGCLLGACRDLTGLPQAVALAREAVKNVRQGLRWAIAYHDALPVLAALGPLLQELTGVGVHPLAGALAACAAAWAMARHARRLCRQEPETPETNVTEGRP